jgi:predicted chitinase
VRVFGVHSEKIEEVPTDALPWATIISGVNNASVSGVGISPTGIVEGSMVFIWFADEAQQKPFVVGTFVGIPQQMDAFLASGGDESISVAPVEQEFPNSANPAPVQSQTTEPVRPIDDLDDISKIPTVAPAGTQNSAIASQNIKLIIDVAKSQGFNTRRSISSLLGIIGGECAWIPKRESFRYSAKRLKEVFPSVFGDNDQLANQYANNERDLPEFLYGHTTKKGKNLGNTMPGDGAKFIGRGFIQLTGRANYERYAKLSGIDIVSNPEILNTDPVASAKVACAYFFDRCKISQSSTTYFDVAKSAVGFNTPDIAQRKRTFYEYFMGGAQTSVAEPVNMEDPKTFSVIKANKEIINSGKIGFKDPNSKFPRYVKEQDTNRLARGENISKTVVARKDSNRTVGINTVGKTWSEQPSPYSAQYPFNKVFESESGHVIEVDDTSGGERIHVYHRSGSYFEIDNTGSRTTRIVGSDYEIIDKNGYIYIKGQCNVTIGGDCNLTVGGNLTGEIAGDANLRIAQDLNVVAQEIKLEAVDSVSIKAGGNIALDGSQVHMNSGVAESSGQPKPSPGNGGNNPSDPTPNRRFDASVVTFELPEDGDSSGMISDGIKKGYIDPDEAAKMPEAGDTAEVQTSNQAPIKADCAAIAGLTSYPDDLRLSPNFTLADVSSKAAVSKYQVVDQNGLTKEEIICNLQAGCINVLENVKRSYPSMFVTSGFRTVAASSKTSQHINGQAFDIQFRGVSKKDYFEIAKALSEQLPVYDQLLLEYSVAANNPWIHISFTRGTNRRQVKTFYNHKKYSDNLTDLG